MTAQQARAHEPWMTTKEAAVYTRRSIPTLDRAVLSGDLRAEGLGRGRGRLYRREWLDAWISGTPA